jgi:hypothetical protein
MTTYHVAALMTDAVHGETVKYLAPNGGWVRNVQNALIFSRAGAIRKSNELSAQGAASWPVMLTTRGKVRNVHTEDK